ncbi:hypothetical protein D0962_37300 [Leptolyngbyaceae cyanobacterium CCMR0082]|uniref:Uncharacterized protein n=2 Tax=Adonisia turfae TaxID=2950184 RepID=A0A6M0SKA6_9CYAN|nr:hypothetical protein [Adonisia turfae]MDV3352636.1 hypothetical protein [Leptothoe sp. LEGE 181152]NEZ61117.1 hypothetical protein [Adonisia turfae CCMR0081]NEZ68323.1 hypothetical protein [Adonisia turfae CCMR0082]
MTSSTDTATPQVTVEEITELITEFEKYRERLTNETLDAAKKAKMSKKETMAKLEPELAKIDAALAQLNAQLAALTPDTTAE